MVGSSRTGLRTPFWRRSSVSRTAASIELHTDESETWPRTSYKCAVVGRKCSRNRAAGMRLPAKLWLSLAATLAALPSSVGGAHQDNSIDGDVGGNRTGRFLLDALFGLEVPSIDDDDDDSGTRLKNCSCDCGIPNEVRVMPDGVGEGQVGGCGAECGVSNQENRIVGGQPAGEHRYPWVARLVYDGQFHCGASLLTANYVLTAAHCVRRLKRSRIRVILGDHDQFIASESQAIMRAVSAIIRHRNFDSESYNHDIALLRLRKPVEFTKIIKPVCLPKIGSEPAGNEGIVVGWGRTAEGGALPAIVQEVKVPILTLAQCRAMKYRASRITSNMLCAGKGKSDSCQGDSGGPLLLQSGDRYEIIGIVSWGVGCGRPGYPGVYTRVARYLSWLQGNLRDTCLCAS